MPTPQENHALALKFFVARDKHKIDANCKHKLAQDCHRARENFRSQAASARGLFERLTGELQNCGPRETGKRDNLQQRRINARETCNRFQAKAQEAERERMGYVRSAQEFQNQAKRCHENGQRAGRGVRNFV